jgi:prepilin-type N-terminal cleavage/methylation domain-containing protein
MRSSGSSGPRPCGRGERGFTLVEILIATVIASILFAAIARMLSVYAKSMARGALKARTAQTEQDLRRLQAAVVQHFASLGGTGYPVAGPWPLAVPLHNPIPWERPAPGFDELGWAPSRSPVFLQYRVDGWATGYVISAVGDLDRDGAPELYRISGDVGMYEGPLPYEFPGGK